MFLNIVDGQVAQEALWTLSKRSNNEGPPSELGPFQRRLGRPGTSGESHDDVRNGRGDWQERSGIVTGGMSALTVSRREKKENRHYCLLALLLPLWAAVLGNEMERSWRLWEGDTKAAACLGTALFVCLSAWVRIVPYFSVCIIYLCTTTLYIEACGLCESQSESRLCYFNTCRLSESNVKLTQRNLLKNGLRSSFDTLIHF